jgi:hypothetical protein
MDDILCIPIVLHISRYIMKMLNNEKSFEISFFHITSAIILFSIIFEFLLPSISQNYTADILDILCYCFGGVVFIFFEKRSKNFNSEPIRISLR